MSSSSAHSGSSSHSSSSSNSDSFPLHENPPLPHKDTLLHKMVRPLLHHQVSLESVLDFAATLPISSSERIQAYSAFVKIIDYYNSYELSLPLVRKKPYNRGKLLQLMYEYAVSDHGRDNILLYFLKTVAPLKEDTGSSQGFSCVIANLVKFEEKSKQEKDQIAQKVQDLADDLVDYFFLPFKSLSSKTPQPTPRFSALLQEDDNIVVGTIEQLSTLRGKCLQRDRHRCVISRQFDKSEARRRFKTDGTHAADDDGNLLLSEEEWGYLEVAHIIPHVLASSDDHLSILNDTKVL